MAKATTTIRQMLNYRSDVQAYFAANCALYLGEYAYIAR
jgi:hypothetical protein